jgi:hypothetical protein
MELLLILFVAMNLLLSAISIPLILQRIPPNTLYGFRVRATLEDPEVWYPVNAYAGKRLFAQGIIAALASLVIYFFPGLSLDAYAYLCLAVFVIIFAVGMSDAWRYLRSFKK